MLDGKVKKAVSLAVLTVGLVSQAVSADQGAAIPDSPLVRFAVQELQKLSTSGELVSQENISRYFSTYPMATDQAEAERLLRTAERIIRGWGERLFRAAEKRARDEGSAVLEPGHIEVEVRRLLPRRETEYKNQVFFPGGPAEEQVPVEIIDLRAFRDTPFPWVALVALAASLQESDPLPMTHEALETFAQAVSDFGLLVFRLGGSFARDEYAFQLASPHLREAEKALMRRAERAEQGNPMAAVEQGQPVGETRTATVFVDVSVESGIRFRHVSSDWISHFRRYGPFAPTFSGGGVAAGDLDGDDWPDLIYCGGEGCAVFRNRRDGTFEDATTRTGLNVPGEARMALIADLDNDGDRDVFLTYARDTNRLFENRGEEKLADVTLRSGLEREGDISGPAVCFDYDNDGLLDLYVGNFGNYLGGASSWLAVDNQNAEPNRLYRNKGGLEFEDVTETTGVGNTGWSQAISHVDYNRDGFQDLYIANDFGTNDLLENSGRGSFLSKGEATGSNDPFHGMNVTFSDLNRDGYPDIFITNIWGWLLTEPEPGEFNDLLLSAERGDGLVGYVPDRSRIPELIERDTGWSWAGLFFDADNDSDDDLFVVNGHSDYSTFLQYRPHPTREGEIYPINNGRETNLFFRNDNGIFRIPAEPSGAELGDLNSRSIALLDYDRDGDLDLALSTFHSEARLFRNDAAPRSNHWLVVELVGDPEEGTSRDAIGTQVVARDSEDLYIWRTVTGGEGYLGMNTLPVELGLGQTTSVDLEILWPGMKGQKIEGVPADRVIRVRQGQSGFETLHDGTL
jgi:hypothetical protein